MLLDLTFDTCFKPSIQFVVLYCQEYQQNIKNINNTNSINSGQNYKNITIVNDTSRAIRMTIISDASTWSVTYSHQLHS